MKKILLILALVVSIILSGCINNQNKSNNLNISDNKNNIESTDTKILDWKELVDTLKSKWLSKNQINKIVEETKQAKQILKNLTGEAKIEYEFKNKTLQKLFAENKIDKKCQTKNIDYVFRCFIKNKKSIEDILPYVPQEQRNYVKKLYYKNYYTSNPKSVFSPNNDPIAIETKKRIITNYIANWIITRPSTCDKIPEKQVRDYCKAVFNP